MASVKTPRHEKAVSVFVLIILFAVAAAIIGPQFFYKPLLTSDSLASKPIESSGPEKIIAALTIKDFSAAKPAVYNADNLYEAIDGKAPFYTDYGFEKLYTEFFQSASDANLNFKLYIFDMADAKNALDVYSQQKRPDTQSFELINVAYKTENAIFFCRGRYYVEIVGSASTDILLTAMTELAGKINTALSAEGIKND